LEDTITTIYYLCDEFLKAVGWPDPVFCASRYESTVTDSNSFLSPSSTLADPHDAANSTGVR
jgi:hypothetical protein